MDRTEGIAALRNSGGVTLHDTSDTKQSGACKQHDDDYNQPSLSGNVYRIILSISVYQHVNCLSHGNVLYTSFVVLSRLSTVSDDPFLCLRYCGMTIHEISLNLTLQSNKCTVFYRKHVGIHHTVI